MRTLHIHNTQYPRAHRQHTQHVRTHTTRACARYTYTIHNTYPGTHHDMRQHTHRFSDLACPVDLSISLSLFLTNNTSISLQCVIRLRYHQVLPSDDYLNFLRCSIHHFRCCILLKGFEKCSMISYYSREMA